jgi:hypothetical protein
MAVEELLQHIHSDAVYRRVPLPDDQNALGPWQEAVKHYVPPDDKDPVWCELIYGAGETGTPVAFPSGPEGDRLREFLERNQKALDFLAAGVRRGRLQLPEAYGDTALDLNGDVARHIVPLSQLLLVKAKCFQADGDVAKESGTAIQMLRIGEMICNGDGVIIHYLMGDVCRKSAVHRIRAMADRSETPSTVLCKLLSTIEHSLTSSDGLAQSLRADFCCWDLVKLEQMPGVVDIEDFVDLLLKICGYSPITGSPEAQYVTPSDDRLAWRREQIIALLRGHPCPFDKIATVRRMGNMVAARIQSMNYLHRPRMFDFAHAFRSILFRIHWHRCWRQPHNMKYWPAQLTPNFSVEGLGLSKEARAELAKLGDCLDAKQLAFLQPPTESDIVLARRKLRRVPNPVGLMLAGCLLATDVRWFASEHRTALEETRDLLTKRLDVQPSSHL